MLSNEIEERLAERLVDRIEEANEYILNKIGNAIKTISELSPSQAYQIQQILKYGGSYEEIAKKLAKVSGRNVKDIYEIFEGVAKDNKEFAKQFYRYRGIDFIPYRKDTALRNMVDSIGTLTARTYMNITNTKGIGFLIEGLDGQLRFMDLQRSYEEIIDRAVLGISQGKTTFQSEMTRILKEVGHSGLVMYNNGRTRRLDSAVRMNVLDGIRQINIETSRRFGAEYGADGVEISVHSAPAIDHEDIQGKQFRNDQYYILENGGEAEDVKGNIYDGSEKRHIAELNCRHKVFNIIVGVSEPEYTDEELEKIRKDNEKGFVYEGKHYTKYEGTQLQRKLELNIRKEKDVQIVARASGDDFKELAIESQKKINVLTDKYNKLCKISGLQPKKIRMSVSGYRKIKV